jgi:hypothetical protein
MVSGSVFALLLETAMLFGVSQVKEASRQKGVRTEQ